MLTNERSTVMKLTDAEAVKHTQRMVHCLRLELPQAVADDALPRIHETIAAQAERIADLEQQLAESQSAVEVLRGACVEHLEYVWLRTETMAVVDEVNRRTKPTEAFIEHTAIQDALTNLPAAAREHAERVQRVVEAARSIISAHKRDSLPCMDAALMELVEAASSLMATDEANELLEIIKAAALGGE